MFNLTILDLLLNNRLLRWLRLRRVMMMIRNCHLLECLKFFMFFTRFLTEFMSTLMLLLGPCLAAGTRL